MSSPPRLSPATSPPYPQHIPLPTNPRKRPSVHTQGFNPSKRRKQSSIVSAASSAHPLRQTSFPPDEALANSAVRSPSVESDVTGITGDGARSTVAYGSGKGVKRRGGKRGKREISGSVTGLGRGASERSVTGDPGEEEEDEEDGGEGLIDDGEEMDKAAERKNLSVLVDAFSPEQTERYEMFRRVKLRKETVRKIANFTLAQSVPPAVITTINGYTKTFVGTLIEKAREVQHEWAVFETPPTTPKQKVQIPIDPTDFRGDNPNNDMFMCEEDSNTISVDVLQGDDTNSAVEKTQKDLGPLLPDHLREALRRYRRDGEAIATGLTGFSVGLGIPGSGSARLHGRRLFR